MLLVQGTLCPQSSLLEPQAWSFQPARMFTYSRERARTEEHAYPKMQGAWSSTPPTPYAKCGCLLHHFPMLFAVWFKINKLLVQVFSSSVNFSLHDLWNGSPVLCLEVSLTKSAQTWSKRSAYLDKLSFFIWCRWPGPVPFFISKRMKV